MKKYIIYILGYIIFIGSFTQLSAEEDGGVCKISDNPAPALTEYFVNVESITSNILEALSEADLNIEESANAKTERNRVLAGFNSILSFGDFFGSFDFKISLPMTNEIPSEVKRDYKHIEKVTGKLTRILKTSEKRKTSGILIENICVGISNCSLSPSSARTLLAELIKNNQKIAQLYRSSILEKPAILTEGTIILVSSDFVSQVQSYYNKDTLTDCSSSEGGFIERIREGISNISSLNSGAQEGIQKWKNAWALLRGGSGVSSNYAEREAFLLASYLEGQGIGAEQAGIIMGNMNRYNAGGLSSSNPLDNSTYNAQAQVKGQIQSFRETLLEKFGNSDNNTVPIAEITRVNTQIKGSEEIKKSIASLYESQIPFSITQDNATQQLQLKIIRMHMSLVKSINILGGEIKSAEKLCDKQGSGNGKCSGYE